MQNLSPHTSHEAVFAETFLMGTRSNLKKAPLLMSEELIVFWRWWARGNQVCYASLGYSFI